MEDRPDHEDIGQMHAAFVGIVEDDDITLGKVIGVALHDHGHGIGYRTEMEGNSFRL